jgi:hypothetical protein
VLALQILSLLVESMIYIIDDDSNIDDDSDIDDGSDLIML